MPKYDITALERFAVKTKYLGVEAANELEAEIRCMEGLEAYDSHEIVEGDDRWLKTLEIELLESQ